MYSVSSNQGFGILAVIFLIAVTGLFVLFANDQFGHRLHAQVKVEQTQEIKNIKRMIIAAASCEESMAALSNCGGTVDIMRKESTGAVTTLIDRDGTRFGRYTLRAKCAESGQGFIIEAARLRRGASVLSNNPSSFVKDPKTRQHYDWARPGAKVLGEDRVLCKNAIDESSRIASFQVYFNVRNDGSEYIEMDLLEPGLPKILSYNEAWLVNPQTGYRSRLPSVIARSNPFSADALNTYATWGLVGGKFGQRYNNALGAPKVRVTFPQPGRVRVALLRNNHMRANGNVIFSVMVIQD